MSAPTLPEPAIPHVLSGGQITAYHRDGCLFPVDVFTPEEARDWAARIEALPVDELAALPAPWTQKTYLLLDWLDALMRDPRLTAVAADLLGEDLLVLSADLFHKPPRSAKRITWHQDLNYWGLEPNEVVTAWVALTIAVPENGAMQYAPGRHQALAAHAEHKADDNMLTKGQELAVAIAPGEAVDVILMPGQVSFHHGLTPHASGPNRTDAPRIGFAIRYAPTGIRQTKGPAMTARLARGADRYGHFQLEPDPPAALSPEALALHRAVLDPHAAYGYSTI
jgi:ectoine hydroxylase-related dioxygenase (phytanoyl-CoA dioxygenase family)